MKESRKIQSKKRNVNGKSLAKKLFLGMVMFLVFFMVFCVPVLKIYGSSVEPTLEPGQIVLSMPKQEVKNGDVIAFWHGKKLLVRRVIAQGGQEVDMDENGKLSVDGQVLKEPYLKKDEIGNSNIDYPHKVKASHYFCVGDKRKSSIDSRNTVIGDVAKEKIKYHLVFRIWPLHQIGWIELIGGSIVHNKRKALIGKLFKTVLSCFIVLCTCFTLLPSSAVQSKTLYQEEPVQTTNEDQTQNEQSVVEEEPSTNTEDSSTQNEPSTNNEEQTTQPSEQSEDETEDESQSDETVSSDGFDLSDSKNKDKL